MLGNKIEKLWNGKAIEQNLNAIYPESRKVILQLVNVGDKGREKKSML